MNRRKFLGFLGVVAVAAPVLSKFKPEMPKPAATYTGNTGDIKLTTGYAGQANVFDIADHKHALLASELPSHTHSISLGQEGNKWSKMWLK